MAGTIVQQGATVLCAHAGQAQPTSVNPRVRVGGRPTVLLPAPWSVAACPLPPNAGGPCATAQWSAGSVRVRSLGQPLVVQGGTATCAPTAVPLNVAVTQLRVTAS